MIMDGGSDEDDTVQDQDPGVLEALFTAIEQQNLAEVKSFIPLITSFNLSDADLYKFGRLPLLSAIRTKNIDVVKLLLEGGASPRARDKFSPTPLHVAAFVAEDIEMVRILMEHGSPVDDLCYGRLTPLILAARRGNLDMVRFILDKGADIEHVAEMEVMPLSLRMHFDYCLPEFMDRNVGPWRYNTPLIEACRYRHFGIVKELLDRGASVNKESRPGKTAVRIASYCMTSERYASTYDDSAKFHIMPACPPILNLLIESGGDVCCVDQFNETPVGGVLNHIATIWQYAETTKYLLQSLVYYYLNLCLLIKAGCPLASAYTVELDSRPHIEDKQSIRTLSILTKAFVKHDTREARFKSFRDELRKAYANVITVAILAGLKPLNDDLVLIKEEVEIEPSSSQIADVKTLMENVISNNFSLKQFCQIKLREIIRPPLRTYLQKLTLPSYLKDCITLDCYVSTKDEVDACLECNDYPGYGTLHGWDITW